MNKKHESYTSLIWTLARTDFALRYHGSVLGYIWAILKPLFIFSILYFVFSAIFNPRTAGNDYYALELMVSIMLFNFFAEGTSAGMSSLLSKAPLITKIYVPRWTLIVASTVNIGLVFLMNLVVVVIFFAWKQFLPSIEGIILFILLCILTYLLVLAFSFVTAPLYIRFRDLQMIWEVALTGIFYATPIIYSLSMMPEWVQRIMLLNPIGFIIHYMKEGLIHGHYFEYWQCIGFVIAVLGVFGLSIFAYKKMESHIAEYI